jgi:hypothetical protein
MRSKQCSGIQIRHILRCIRILRSVNWITDPHPDLFISGSQDSKKLSFYAVFLLMLLLTTTYMNIYICLHK